MTSESSCCWIKVLLLKYPMTNTFINVKKINIKLKAFIFKKKTTTKKPTKTLSMYPIEMLILHMWSKKCKDVN